MDINKKSILIVISFAVLILLLLAHVIVLYQTQNELGYSHKLLDLVLSIIGYEFHQRGFEPIQFPQLVAGNEDRFCQVYDGVWNADMRECHGISDLHCQVITGTFQQKDNTCKF